MNTLTALNKFLIGLSIGVVIILIYFRKNISEFINFKINPNLQDGMPCSTNGFSGGYNGKWNNKICTKN